MTASRDRRPARRAVCRTATAVGRYRITEKIVLDRWGGVPQTTTGIPSWTETDARPTRTVMRCGHGSEQLSQLNCARRLPGNTWRSIATSAPARR